MFRKLQLFIGFLLYTFIVVIAGLFCVVAAPFVLMACLFLVVFTIDRTIAGVLWIWNGVDYWIQRLLFNEEKN